MSARASASTSSSRSDDEVPTTVLSTSGLRMLNCSAAARSDTPALVHAAEISAIDRPPRSRRRGICSGSRARAAAQRSAAVRRRVVAAIGLLLPPLPGITPALARARFSQDGFAATTIRRVAADAGVDPSQVIRFFGSKDELFAAVMSVPGSALQQFATAFEGPDAHLGERVVRAYLNAWEGPAEVSEPLVAMLRGAVANEQANVALREFIQSRLLPGMSGRDEDGTLRAGVAVLLAADTDTLVATVRPALQHLLTTNGPHESAAAVGCRMPEGQREGPENGS